VLPTRSVDRSCLPGCRTVSEWEGPARGIPSSAVACLVSSWVRCHRRDPVGDPRSLGQGRLGRRNARGRCTIHDVGDLAGTGRGQREVGDRHPCGRPTAGHRRARMGRSPTPTLVRPNSSDPRAPRSWRQNRQDRLDGLQQLRSSRHWRRRREVPRSPRTATCETPDRLVPSNLVTGDRELSLGAATR
jgi:hypothetical protein